MDLHHIINSSRLYSGKISIRLDKYHLGDKIIDKEIVEHPDSVGIIALDNNENIILVEQFRIATRNSLIEIPAGKIEKGKTYKHAALRDIKEKRRYRGIKTPIYQLYIAC